MESAALKTVLHHLSSAMTYTEPTNTETNRKLWNQYAQSWSAEAETADAAAPEAGDEVRQEWLVKMGANVGRDSSQLKFLGDEWSDERSLHAALSDFLYPYLSVDDKVCELGVGGGRVAARVWPRVKQLSGFDIAESMLDRAQSALRIGQDGGAPNVDLHLLGGDYPQFPQRYHGQFDFVYSFDVLVHVDLHTLFQYLQQFKKLLRPGGKVMVHTANVMAPLGWERFAKQKSCSAGGFYFHCPQQVMELAKGAGFTVIKRSFFQGESRPRRRKGKRAKGKRKKKPVRKADAGGSNIYYERDFLCVLQVRKPKYPTDKTSASYGSAHDERRTV